MIRNDNGQLVRIAGIIAIAVVILIVVLLIIRRKKRIRSEKPKESGNAFIQNQLRKLKVVTATVDDAKLSSHLQKLEDEFKYAEPGFHNKNLKTVDQLISQSVQLLCEAVQNHDYDKAEYRIDELHGLITDRNERVRKGY